MVKEQEESRSGDLEKEAQSPLWDQMVKDLRILLGFHMDDTEWLEWFNSEVKSYGGGSASRPRGLSSGIFHRRYDADFFLRQSLLHLKPIQHSQLLLYSLKIETGNSRPVCRMKINKSSGNVDFEIFVNGIDEITAQEELLHAAEFVLFGTDAIPTFNTFRTAEQLVHTSLMLDMALSAAATELGTWDHWQQKAQALTRKHREKYLQSHLWKSNLLGKDLNQRFHYQNTSLEQIGRSWRNLGGYFEYMFSDRILAEQIDYETLDDSEGIEILEAGPYVEEVIKGEGDVTISTIQRVPNDEMIEVFELGCLAYGVLHRDLSYRLVDLPVSHTMSEREVGRLVVEWAKMVLREYEGTEREDELLTHRSEAINIPPSYFNYTVPQEILEEIVGTTEKPHHSLSNRINSHSLSMIAYKNWTLVVDEIMTEYDLQRRFPDPERLSKLLESHHITKQLFQYILAFADRQFRGQFRD